MSFLSRRPAPPLERWVESVWTSERVQGLPHAREWGLPTGRADLVVPLDRDDLLRYDNAADDAPVRRLAGGVLQGAMMAPVLRDTSGASIVVGAHFRPAGLAALFEGPADRVAGLAVPLDDLWPAFAATLQAQAWEARALQDPVRRLSLFEQALTARLHDRCGHGDDLVEWAWRRLAAGVSVGEVQRASGWSPASFARRYRAVCGLMPKQHGSVMRFQRALHTAARGRPWAEVAAATGYADQAHLSRSFQALAGMPPREVRREATPFTNHLRWR